LARTSRDDETEREQSELCIHIFSVSAGLVGVCLTVIGLIQIVQHLRDANTLVDNLLAADALGFLASCLLAYLALRARGARRTRFEQWADLVFLASLVGMTGSCAVIAYQLV
jgi:multisubunit Na+/H+ antiporter MnhF subunit